MIRIASKQAGFRRCGMPHPKEPVDYPDDKFSKDEIKSLKAEPMLMVEIVPDEPKEEIEQKPEPETKPEPEPEPEIEPEPETKPERSEKIVPIKKAKKKKDKK